MKVLVIDPWTVVATALAKRYEMRPLRTALETYVFELETDYDRALARLADPDRYDAVVVDPYPPVNGKKPGADYVEAVARQGPIVIVVTASWRIEECVECMRAGASDFIQKTRGVEQIVDLVSGALESAVARRPPPRDPDVEYVNDSLGQLCRDYGGQWIAVSHRQVIEVAESDDELLELVRDMPLQPRLWRLPQGWVSDDAD